MSLLEGHDLGSAIIFGNPGRVSTFLLCHHACCEHFFNSGNHGFPMAFFGGRRWSRKDIFLRSCFWGEWNKHTWSHMKGMKVKFRRNKKWMFCQHGYVGGNRETLEIFPPKKKSITPFWWASAGGVSQVRGVCQVFCGARVGEYYAPLDLCHVKALLSYKKVALLSHSQPSNSRNSHGHMISTFV